MAQIRNAACDVAGAGNQRPTGRFDRTRRHHLCRGTAARNGLSPRLRRDIVVPQPGPKLRPKEYAFAAELESRELEESRRRADASSMDFDYYSARSCQNVDS